MYDIYHDGKWQLQIEIREVHALRRIEAAQTGYNGRAAFLYIRGGSPQLFCREKRTTVVYNESERK